MNQKRARLVALSALCIMAGLYGILANCTGVLFAGILQDMGFRAGDLSLFYTIKSIVAALTLTFAVKMVLSKHCKWVMAAFGLLSGLSYIMMFFFHELWQWYAAAAISGIAGGCGFTVLPIIINNHYKKNNGMVIGIVMSGSGIAGMIYSPILSWIIGVYGWRFAAVITGLVAMLLICVPSLLFLEAAPSKEQEERQKEDLDEVDSREKAGKSKDFSIVLFIICLLMIMFPALEITFANQMSTFAISAGFTLAVGGLMTSISMIGNISGKFLLGLLSDKVGIFKAMMIMIGFGTLSMFCFMMASTGDWMLYIAALCFGFTYSLYSTAPSLFLMEFYGRSQYASIFSRIQAINTLICALGGSGIAYIYDLTGSFTPVFILFVIMNVAMFVFALILLQRKREEKCVNMENLLGRD